MKKNLLLMMMCVPVLLAAQNGNGVAVSGLAVNAGTVTFNVSWDKNNPDMPLLWSDSVWVFVDYNDAGVMKRLPVTDATASAGTVTKVPNNDKGVWVIGNARTNDSFSATVELFTEIKDVAGACAYASNYPPVGEYLSSFSEISFTGTPMYEISFTNSGGKSVTVKSGDTLLLPCDYTLTSFTDVTGAPGILVGNLGTYQPQGSCTYTEPAVVGTFAHFSSDYTASTYVSLVDERDNKTYPVVKIGNHWVMARNLNYQKNLTWHANSNSPSTVSGGSVTALIGNFWCPGTSSAMASTREACEVYGALYSWETAMMLDGYGTWTEIAIYNTGAANTDNAKLNHGRSAYSDANIGGRGICPVNWHVPTDFEWGVFFDAMEGGGTVHQSAPSNVWYGTNAGKYAKSACTGTSSDTDPLWADNANRGTDLYGFRVLPAGRRSLDGSNFINRGNYAFFWSSTPNNALRARALFFVYNRADVRRYHSHRSYGMSVRCIKD
jgi:uncharacterized protein (TIGR02145 family)